MATITVRTPQINVGTQPSSYGYTYGNNSFAVPGDEERLYGILEEPKPNPQLKAVSDYMNWATSDKGFGLLGELMLGESGKAVENMAYGMPNKTPYGNIPVPNMGLIDLAMLAPFGALGRTKNVGKLKGYLHHTDINPNEFVGKRFETEFQGGLAPKIDAPIEEMKGGSLITVPYDQSSRNYKLGSVSGLELKGYRPTTHAGQDYVLDYSHIDKGVVGASGLDVVTNLRRKIGEVRRQNLKEGGTGRVFMTNSVMGQGAMDFSVQPMEGVLGILDNQPLKKADIVDLDKSIKETPKIVQRVIDDKKQTVKTYPFKNFKGIMTPEGRDQLYGYAYEGSSGDLRKALMANMRKKDFQKRFNFNVEDLDMALTDPSLANVPAGFIGNAIIEIPEGGMDILKGSNISYPYDFTGKYFGSVGGSFHPRIVYGKTYDRIYDSLATQYPNKNANELNAMTIGAITKRKDPKDIAVMMGDQEIESLLGLQSEFKKNPQTINKSIEAFTPPKSLLEQQYTSAKTSINKDKLPAVFNKLDWDSGTVNLDVGGGKFDNATEFLADKNVKNLVYDPFNRTAEHNTMVLNEARNTADTATISNVLNVIPDEANQIETLETAYKHIKPNGKVYITVYEGNKSGVGKATGADQYQQNKKLQDYLSTVKKVFPNVKIEKGMIIATKE